MSRLEPTAFNVAGLLGEVVELLAKEQDEPTH